MNRKQRHLGRELALQWLYQIDVGQQAPDDVMASVPEDLEELPVLAEEGIAFARLLATGVLAEKARIDAIITQYATDWPLARMAAIERNVLRIALYEILTQPDIPHSVTADEAVDIAKHYGARESGKFVNGILGAYLRDNSSEE